MRRCALVLNIHRTTVERKLIYLAKKAELSQERFLQTMKAQVTHLQFDDLITIEHTKLKPLTVSIAVDVNTRSILGAQVGVIGAFGHLAELSRRKYGRRINEHKKTLRRLFNEVAPAISPMALIRSDEHKFYAEFVENYLPGRKYEQYPSIRSSIAGQGELKKTRRDPLFGINHTCAMLRANVNRLIRKTWCTTKTPQMLQRHLMIYVDFHNSVYLKA